MRTSENAYKKYLASRPAASADANARVKKIKFFALRALEDFLTATPALQQSALANHSSSKSKKSSQEIAVEERKLQEAKHDLIVQMRNFRPPGVS